MSQRKRKVKKIQLLEIKAKQLEPNLEKFAIKGAIGRMTNTKKRKFIAFEDDNKVQVFREQLAEFPKVDWLQIVNKIGDLSNSEEIIKAPVYKQIKGFNYDFGRLRIGNYRVLIHRITNTEWLMLHVFRKDYTGKIPQNELLIGYKRLIEYKNREDEE